MTLAEAKLIKKGHYLCDEKEARFHSHKSYRVSWPPWYSADGTLVRFYLAALGGWVSYEGFVRELNPFRPTVKAVPQKRPTVEL